MLNDIINQSINLPPISFLLSSSQGFGSCTQVDRLQFLGFRSTSSFLLPFACLSRQTISVPNLLRLSPSHSFLPGPLGFAFPFLPTLRMAGSRTKRVGASRASADIHTEATTYTRHGEDHTDRWVYTLIGLHTDRTTHGWGIHTDGITHVWDYTRIGHTPGWDYTRMGLYTDGAYTRRTCMYRKRMHT